MSPKSSANCWKGFRRLPGRGPRLGNLSPLRDPRQLPSRRTGCSPRWHSSCPQASGWSTNRHRTPPSSGITSTSTGRAACSSPPLGGLGFGLPAAVGVALADPTRPVVAVLGDGAARYGVAGLWTAAQWDLPVTFVVLRNGGYGALQGFVNQLGITDPPGLDLRGLDSVGIARGYGIPAQHLTDAEEVVAALKATTPASGPRLLEIPVHAETRLTVMYLSSDDSEFTTGATLAVDGGMTI
ncbi:thiamine pyrophosphate-dependent enzyme [Streptomyces sp. UG1]|uniref:thiamine pyrophosphate-dependent enzyme n=1 Tax=Streptomyces sp. UG1 TaxID=3417652 RepID=UPI003CE9A7E0